MKKLLVIALALFVAMVGVQVFAINMGDTLTNAMIKDSADKPSQIPDLGVKVMTIFYNDADAADLADPLSDALKAKKYDESKYRGQGIANLKDSKAPNWLIRRIIKGKEKKYDTKILTDPSYMLKSAWNLADCNNSAVIIIVGKDKKVKYVNYLRATIPAAEVNKIVALVDSLLK
jgi:hypothetical protein